MRKIREDYIFYKITCGFLIYLVGLSPSWGVYDQVKTRNPDYTFSYNKVTWKSETRCDLSCLKIRSLQERSMQH